MKALIATVIAVGAIGVSGCGHSASSTPAAASSSSPSSGPTATGDSGQSADPTASAATPPGTQTSHPRPAHSAARASFHSPVRYPNGLSVSVERISEHKDTQTGPGSLPGRPVTTFLLRFSNSTHTSLNLESVVVDAAYGEARTAASPIYDSNAQNFHKVLRSGHSVSASYSFSVPARHRDDVELTVNFRPGYSSAIFVGAAVASGH